MISCRIEQIRRIQRLAKSYLDETKFFVCESLAIDITGKMVKLQVIACIYISFQAVIAFASLDSIRFEKTKHEGLLAKCNKFQDVPFMENEK